MTKDEVAAVLAKPYSLELLNGPIPARFSYIGLDGDPRVVPIGFHFDGERLQLFTVVKSAKVRALRKNPRVAITIDTEGFPPKVLLIRGTAELTLEDGVPDQYVTAAAKVMRPDQLEEWKAGVTALYEQMYRITVTPTWAKLLDFETTIPKAVEDLIVAQQAKG